MSTLDDVTAEASATKRLVRTCADRGAQVAFVGGARPDGGPGSEPLSHASFACIVRAAAAGLTWRGLRPGDVVGILVPDAVGFAIAMHAVRAAGGVPSPVDVALGPGETAGQLGQSGARMVITSPPLAEGALAAADRSWVRQVFSFYDAPGTTRFGDLLGLDMIRPHAGQPGDVALLSFRRGEDGGLSPMPVTHSEYGDHIDRAAQTADLGTRDVVLVMPPAGDGLAFATLVDCALLSGATSVAVRRQDLATAAIVHQGTAAIVPRAAAHALPDNVRVLPVG